MTVNSVARAVRRIADERGSATSLDVRRHLGLDILSPEVKTMIPRHLNSAIAQRLITGELTRYGPATYSPTVEDCSHCKGSGWIRKTDSL